MRRGLTDALAWGWGLGRPGLGPTLQTQVVTAECKAGLWPGAGGLLVPCTGPEALWVSEQRLPGQTVSTPFLMAGIGVSLDCCGQLGPACPPRSWRMLARSYAGEGLREHGAGTPGREARPAGSNGGLGWGLHRHGSQLPTGL